MTFLIALGVPFVDQWKDARDKQTLTDAQIRIEAIDFKGKSVLVVSRASIDFCEAILRYGEAGSVVMVSPTREELAAFVQTGSFDPLTEAHRLAANGSQIEKTPIRPINPSGADMVLVTRPLAKGTALFRRHLPRTVRMANARVSYFLTQTRDGGAVSELTPLVLKIMHEDRSFRYPFHPFYRTRLDRLDFDDERAYVFGLFCHNPAARNLLYCKDRDS